MSQQRHSRPTFARTVLAVLGVTGLLLFAVFAFIPLTHSVAMANTPLDVIAYWQLDESEAGTYSDSIDGHIATCSGANCPLPAVGQVAGGQYFDGDETTPGPNIPDDDVFDWSNTDSFSIELWMQGVVGRTCTATGVFNNEIMFGRREGNMQLWLGCLNTTGQAAFQLKDSNNNGILVESPNSVVDGGWHHLVAVRDGSTNENLLYVDGVLAAMTDTVAYDGTFAASVPLNLGYLNFDATNKFRFEGTLDETAVYSRVLTSEEIARHYDYGRAGHGYQILPGILIEKSPDQTIQSGSSAMFTIELTNVGDVDLAGVQVVDPLAPACEFAVGELPMGDSFTDSCSVNNVTASFTNTATVTAGLQVAKEALPGTAPANTLAYWKLNETSPSATTFVDSVGTHDATCSGAACPRPADGLIDGGQFFNGNVDGANVPDDDVFDWGNNDSFSVELWMEGIPGRTCAGSGATNNEVMFGRTEGGGTMQLWLGCFNETGQAAFQLKSGTVGGVIKSPASIVDGGWHHLVAVRDGDAGANYLYVDGALTAMTDTLTYTGDFASNDPINIGYLDFNTTTAFELFDGVYLNAATTFNFDGTLDEIAVYNRALSATEIEMHYQNGLDSVGYDETAGDTVTVADVSVTDSASVVVAEGTVLYMPLVFK